MDEIKKLPPVTRTILAAVAIVTLPCLLQLVSVYHFVFIKERVFGQAEIWRLLTPFLYGGKGLPLIFDSFLLFRNLNDLEERHFGRRTADLTWALILICAGIHTANLYFLSGILFRPFLIGITHLWAQTNPTTKVSLFGLLNIPAPYFPWALLAIDLVKGGPIFALQGLIGLISSHLYYFATSIYPAQNGGVGLRWIETPGWLVNLVGNGGGGGGGGGGTGGGGTPSFATPFRRPGGGRRLGATPGSLSGGIGGEAPVSVAGGGAVGGTAREATPGGSYRWGGGGQRLGEE